MTTTAEKIQLEEQVALKKNRLDQAQEALDEARREYQEALRELENFNRAEEGLGDRHPREYELTGSD